MAFNASKKREKRAPKPPGYGSPIIPSAAIQAWYKKQLTQITDLMIARSYKRGIKVMSSTRIQ